MAKETIESELNIGEILKRVLKKKFYPIYLFYGEEKFLIDEVVASILEKSIEPELRQLNVEKYSCSEVDSETIVTAALSIPMLAGKKVVIVRNFEKVNDSKSLQVYYQNPSQSTILILIAEGIDKRKNVFSKIGQSGIIVKSDPLKRADILDWINARFVKHNKSILPEAAEILYEIKGNSLQEIDTEIEKLVTFVYERAKVSKEDVLTVIGSSREFNVFELTNSIGKGDKVKSIKILENLLNQNVEPLFILAMLTRHFIILWKTSLLKKQGKSLNEIASIIQVNPYFMRDYFSQAEIINSPRIEKCLKNLLDADLLLKSVSLSKRIIIENLLCQLLDQNSGRMDYSFSNIEVSIEI